MDLPYHIGGFRIMGTFAVRYSFHPAYGENLMPLARMIERNVCANSSPSAGE